MPSKGYQSSQLFYGRLSEMRLWTRPLSAREIKANVCGVDPSTNGLVSYWRMNEKELLSMIYLRQSVISVIRMESRLTGLMMIRINVLNKVIINE